MGDNETICDRAQDRVGFARRRQLIAKRLALTPLAHAAHANAEGFQHAPDVHFEVVYGVSANARNWWDNPGGERIGYAPEDNAEDYADEMLAKMKPDDEPVTERLFHGGLFCGMEFTGDASKID